MISMYSHRPARRYSVALVLLTGTVIVAGCSQPARADASAVKPGFGHVHALANNPEDGTTYAATHTGIFRLGPTGPVRVADHIQDTMGFAVIGRNRFLGSGHPGPHDAGPVNVGLIRSDDGGLSWSPVALGGQTDFHALSVEGGTVYGWDAVSMMIMRSDDGGIAWQRGATISDVGALAVDPDDKHRVLATSSSGLLESADGGTTFAAAVQQPPRPLVLVDHAARIGGGGDTTLAGIDQTGTLWASTGGVWSGEGSLGAPPQAFKVLGPGRYVVATSDGVHSTEDAGRTWNLVAASG
ncbi:F510_1955 family glycosylhydrolase [Pseudonocardia sp. GCM10023141]|uniref:F510_1955 family glycosylhydrolase n=1 Tax=Pseudonocardia sp. GCM10023141 TaxID=3252653 RepID=UPI0036239711